MLVMSHYGHLELSKDCKINALFMESVGPGYLFEKRILNFFHSYFPQKVAIIGVFEH